MENPLSEKVIHRIQYLLNAKEAARTTILSKSWCRAWHTRPNLDFNQFDFPNRSDEFSKFTKKTIKRYEDLNLNVRSLRLYMKPQWSSCQWSTYHDSPLATELIVKALKLGAINFKIHLQTGSKFLLPDELLQSQTLARLSVSGFAVDLRRRNGEDLTCSYPNLKSLKLTGVQINGDLIRDLNSRWPLIEELTLGYPRNDNDPEILGELHKLEFPKLKYLCLRLDVKFILSRHDAWAKFPCLKELVIWESNSYNNLQICSRSLECIRIRLLDNSVWNLELDVPNIRVFQYKGSPFSRFEFKETSCKGWESNISITSPRCHIPGTWFSSLNKLVKMLSMSRVYLSMNVKIPPGQSFDCYGRDGVAAPAAAVENLTLEGDSVTVAFVENVILSCRPNSIYVEEENVKLVQELRVQPWMTFLDSAMWKHKFVHFLLK